MPVGWIIGRTGLVSQTSGVFLPILALSSEHANGQPLRRCLIGKERESSFLDLQLKYV